MHSSNQGLIFERSPYPNETKSLPLLFCMTHPLKDISPIIMCKNKQLASFLLADSKYKLVSICEELNIAVMYCNTDGSHSVWKLRLASDDDLKHMNLNVPLSNIADPSWSVESPLTNRNKSMSKSIFSPITISISSKASSPSLNKTKAQSSTSSGFASPLRSSRLPSGSLVSPQLKSFIGSPSSLYTPTHSSPQVSTDRRTSIHELRSPISRLCATPILRDFFDYSDISNESLKPDLCLDFLWADHNAQNTNKACKAFVTTDFLKQTYLLMAFEQQQILRLVKLKLSNEGEHLIFGASHTITGKHVENLPSRNLLIVVDVSNTLVLYSGLTKIGVVHLPASNDIHWRISTPTKRNSNLSLPSTLKHSTFTSMSQSSFLGSNPKFSIGSHVISPVVSDRENSRLTNSLKNLRCEPSFSDFKDTIASQLTVESCDDKSARFALPLVANSAVVELCLNALKALLPKDISMNFLAKWYAVRNVSGSYSLSDKQELEMFKNCLLSNIGYDAEGSSASLQETFKIKKLKVEADEKGSDEDWIWLQHSTDTKKSLRSSITYFGTNFIHYLRHIFYALHLTYEELKLHQLLWQFVPQLVDILFLFATDLGLIAYQDHYWRDFSELCSKLDGRSLVAQSVLKELVPLNNFPETPPAIYSFLLATLKADIYTQISPFPYIPGVLEQIRHCVILFACIQNAQFGERKFIYPIGKLTNYSEFHVDLALQTDRILYALNTLGLNQNDIHALPGGIALPLLECITSCRKNPPSDSDPNCYDLIGRHDLVKSGTSMKNDVSELSKPSNNEMELEDDSLWSLNKNVLKLLFPDDQRLIEAYNLLQSSKPVKISISQRPGISDHDFIEEQERHLYTLSIRTMALPVGRGMLTLRSYKPVVAETFPIPKLCLSGRVPPRNTAVELSHIDIPTNMNTWPLFHNGVAAGLRASPAASDIIDSSWIVYNRPKSTSSLAVEAQNEHAGFLLALGLNGHLSKLSVMNIHDYLYKGNELTRVAVLLGLAAAKRGTMDPAATKVLSIHVEALLPPTSTELDVPPVVQVAAVLGVGLLYQSSGQHHIAEVLLGEIGRPPGPEMEHYIDRESYALSAGLAFGLVMLGKGNEMVSMVCSAESVSMADQLCNYMIGGHKKPLTTVQREKYKTPSYQIREGEYVNADVTSPGATLALGMLFFDTCNEAVAKWVTAPDTQHLLETVRPDFLLLRTLAKGLIGWSRIVASKEWIDDHVPPVVKENAFQRQEDYNTRIDYETMSQAYCNIVAGACMALGLKHAGTADEHAFKVVMGYTRMFLALPNRPQQADQAGRSTIESCLNVLIVSLSLIMAGTGNVEVMKICRYLRSRTSQVNVVLYGSHMATHMALGFLFLGGCRYTISTSPEAIAALVCALFPKFPIHSNDNRYHLQAFRHLYALAVEPRLIIPRDVMTGHFEYVHFRIVFKKPNEFGESHTIVRAPCLIPELDLIEEVSVDDSRYWRITFNRSDNWESLK